MPDFQPLSLVNILGSVACCLLLIRDTLTVMVSAKTGLY